MVAPINYTIDVKDPFTTAMAGINAGLGLQQAQQAQQQRGIALQQQQAAIQQQQTAMQRQQQLNQAMAEFANNPNKTPEDYQRITTMYPEVTKPIQDSLSLASDAQKKSYIGQASQLFAAIKAGRTDVASQLADQFAEHYKGAGDADGAQTMATLSKLISLSPQTAETTGGLFLSQAMGGKEFADMYPALLKTPFEAQKTEAETRNLDSQVADRAARLGLDRDKLMSETQTKLYEMQQKANPALNLSGDAMKLINESAASSVASSQLADRSLSLANEFDKMDSFSGLAGGWAEQYKKATGDQNSVSNLKQEFLRIRSGEIGRIAKSMGGQFTDTDMKLALQAFPPENADPKFMASYLRGMAKLNAITSATENAKSEWVNSVGHLGKARSDIEIDGVAVPSGTTFTRFAEQFVKEKAAGLTAQKQQNNLATRPYARWMQPQGNQ